MFLHLKPIEGGTVTFGGMRKGQITCIGKIGIPSLNSIDNVLCVEELKYNMLTISQLSDSGYSMSFNKDLCIIKTKDDKSFLISKEHNNLYKIDLKGLSK